MQGWAVAVAFQARQAKHVCRLHVFKAVPPLYHTSAGSVLAATITWSRKLGHGLQLWLNGDAQLRHNFREAVLA